jgi:hypothetical protein
MAVTTRKVRNTDALGHKILVVPLITAISQADVLAYKFIPGHAFEIVGVEGWARTEAGVVTADVKIEAVTSLAAVIAFATATRVVATLAATLAARRGSASNAINVHFTTDGTGALTNGFVTVRYRPMPMSGDAGHE